MERDTATGYAILREYELRKRAYARHTARELRDRLAPYTLRYDPPNEGHSVRVSDAIAPPDPLTLAGVVVLISQ